MTIPLPAPLAIAGVTFSPIAAAIGAMYGIASNINDYFDKHIADMRRSANTTIEKTGRVLEAAKYGFGVGYLSSVIIIAVGQLLLGTTFAAVVTVATAATLTNPIAMTCGAIGAIIYGWNALSDEERNDILGKLSKGLEIGVEFIRSIVTFVIRMAKELMDSKVLKDLKKFITEKAALFGRSLSDVTHSTVDAISDAGTAVLKHTSVAIEETRRVAGRTTDKIGEVLTDAARATGDTFDAAGGAVKKHTGAAINETRRVASKTSNKVGEVVADVAKTTGTALEHSADAATEAAKKVYESGKGLVARPRKDPPTA
jgi:hypothetical protein